MRVKNRREEYIAPLPPYTTDEVLRDANRILKMNASRAMSALQKLFENGFITYHRTDSTRVSEKGMEIAKMFLDKDFVPRTWEGKGEGAHECIRPTRPLTKNDLMSMVEQGVIGMSEKIGREEMALYDIIFRRFMASQAPKIRAVRNTYEISFDGKVIEHDAVESYYGRAYELYPYLAQQLMIKEGKYEGEIIERSLPLAHTLTQADVIRMMKERGIGRPSTYAIIISKLLRRGYVIERNGRLIPTSIGIRVYDFLAKHYGEYVSEETTRHVYELMDRIESGRENADKLLRRLYEEITDMK